MKIKSYQHKKLLNVVVTLYFIFVALFTVFIFNTDIIMLIPSAIFFLTFLFVFYLLTYRYLYSVTFFDNKMEVCQAFLFRRSINYADILKVEIVDVKDRYEQVIFEMLKIVSHSNFTVRIHIEQLNIQEKFYINHILNSKTKIKIKRKDGFYF